jgi:hypothetical protein
MDQTRKLEIPGSCFARPRMTGQDADGRDQPGHDDAKKF